MGVVPAGEGAGKAGAGMYLTLLGIRIYMYSRAVNLHQPKAFVFMNYTLLGNDQLKPMSEN